MQSSQIQSSRETLYFIISLLFSILIYIVAIVSVVGIAIALLVAAFIVYIQLMMLGSIRGNGVRIHQNQFPRNLCSYPTISTRYGASENTRYFRGSI